MRQSACRCQPTRALLTCLAAQLYHGRDQATNRAVVVKVLELDVPSCDHDRSTQVCCCCQPARHRNHCLLCCNAPAMLATLACIVAVPFSSAAPPARLSAYGQQTMPAC